MYPEHTLFIRDMPNWDSVLSMNGLSNAVSERPFIEYVPVTATFTPSA
jgi:hypothetical protein